jgi:Protein of unknown function (DUF2721)
MDWLFNIQQGANVQSVLGVMITPAVLITASTTLVFSTSTRLARVVDRVRELDSKIEQLSAAENVDFLEEKLVEIDRQLAVHARRSQYIQRSLTSFYISLGIFVATTVAIGIDSLLGYSMWLPNVLGIGGALVLFYGSVLLIAETGLALRSINSEMAFTLMLREKYQQRRSAAAREAGPGGAGKEAAPGGVGKEAGPGGATASPKRPSVF